jgi:aryl-alcohol dehydrogenase-like predicted oxidoreductase
MTWGEQNTEEEAWEQLDYAVQQGINFIDTGKACRHLCGVRGQRSRVSLVLTSP